MIGKLPYETLFQVYQDSIKYSLEKEFIDMLKQELDRREALIMESGKTLGSREDHQVG
jgi:hypothetical protein